MGITILEPTIPHSALAEITIRENNEKPRSKHSIVGLVEAIIQKSPDLEEPFYVLDLATVISLMNRWKLLLPNIPPFYAVKCNPDPAFLTIMSALGANFDCASRREIETVLSLRVSPERIIYSNPTKAASHIRYAASVGVNLTTFDSKYEIKKIKMNHPECESLIRIKVDDSDSKFQLGTKFGALKDEFIPLLLEAKAEGLKLRGVSFHVGSSCMNPKAYETAIALARLVFDMANRLGLPRMDVLNIGGGFISTSKFNETAIIIKSSIKEYFGEDDDIAELKVIAEPGNFFAFTSFTLAAAIIGKRVRGELRDYWINDGTYGSLKLEINEIIGSDVTKILTPLACESNKDNPLCKGMCKHRSNVFGPTCDSADIVTKDELLPELEMKDWLVFENMGSYMASLGSSFNGFATSDIKTYVAYSYADDNSINGLH